MHKYLSSLTLPKLRRYGMLELLALITLLIVLIRSL